MENQKQKKKEATTDGPNIVIIDIETSPRHGTFWGQKWETSIIEVTDHSQIISYSAKWLKGAHVTKCIADYKGYKAGEINDRLLVADLWSILDGADVVVAQNGNAFDTRVINARFAFHGMTPPSPYKTVDTMLVSRQRFNLPSNKLNDICDYFGLGRKVEHEGYPLWQKCEAGEKAAWTRMKTYNKQDVALTEKLYLLLLPWVKTHPNVGMFTDKIVCPRCGSGKMQARGFAINNSTKYRRLQCQGCGGWSRTSANVQENKPLTNI